MVIVWRCGAEVGKAGKGSPQEIKAIIPKKPRRKCGVSWKKAAMANR